MFRTILMAITLFGLWLAMSGVYKPLIVGFGVASALFTTWMVIRMDKIADDERLVVRLNPLRFISYTGWLLVEIARANWAVTKIIMAPEMPIKQHFFRVPFSQKTDVGQTIFANSITLTPGTISVEVEDEFFWVHALGYSDQDVEALEDMDARVSRVETI
ncbi:Na+/H+ antiporter subunit E [Alphaproteobacteria bacterium KMM 3653]|uniref:Na+/H+ antiporter subunit E n=1 Tax=Harenicola maris TaxID=2841044 RepID=A0AAP2G9R9_9RHOB|nr:Na+/H+ antiporter subunit E [Harenicola maris]